MVAIVDLKVSLLLTTIKKLRIFEPITLRKISEYGIRYKLPKTNEES